MVGPLDNQIVINQSVATEKVQEVQQRHPDLQQKHFALQLQEEEERKRRDVRDTEKPGHPEIRARERKAQEKGRKKRSKKPPSRARGTTRTDDSSEDGDRLIDIFV
jgi:hypothetical protein